MDYLKKVSHQALQIYVPMGGARSAHDIYPYEIEGGLLLQPRDHDDRDALGGVVSVCLVPCENEACAFVSGISMAVDSDAGQMTWAIRRLQEPIVNCRWAVVLHDSSRQTGLTCYRYLSALNLLERKAG